MSKIINKIINYILNRRKQKLEETMKILKPKTYANSTSKMHINATSTLILTSETEKNLEKVDAHIKTIVNKYLKSPEKLLDFVEEHGTKVYKISNADKILEVVKEEEGFITPARGAKAFYLNFITGMLAEKRLHFSFETKEMFVLRDLPLNVYYMIHQFHKWYGFKENLPGYDALTQEKFKENFENLKDADFTGMSIEEIISMKEAIARDAEAVDFVIKLAREKSGAKSVLNKMKNDGSASI